jgi:hypothetical protein
MDIPNLSTEPVVTPSVPKKYSLPMVFLVIVGALITGYLFSRIYPRTSGGQPLLSNQSSNPTRLSTDNITNKEELKVGVIYGNQEKVFKDTAVGVIEKGNINGEGTHILNRPGGPTQRASLTSSAVDLDLFIGKNVEIKGETNASTKTSWLIDVVSIKILE